MKKCKEWSFQKFLAYDLKLVDTDDMLIESNYVEVILVKYYFF